MSIDLQIRAGNARDLAAGLTALDLTPPKPVTDAADLLAAAEALTDPAPATEGAAFAARNAKDLAAAVEAHAAWAVRRAAFSEARTIVVDQRARALVSTVAAHRDDIVSALAEPFATAAADFTDGLAHLPTDIDPAALVAAGGETVDAYGRTLRAAEELTNLRNLRNLLADLTAEPSGIRLPVLRVATAPADHLDHLAQRYHELRTVGGIEPWATLVRAGAVLELHGPAQVAQLDAQARQAEQSAHQARRAADPAVRRANDLTRRHTEGLDRLASRTA